MLYFPKVCIFLFFFYFNPLNSQNLNIVRDAEIENFLTDLSFPIIQSSSIKNTKINFYLDKQNYINAFVTHGSKIFITTELLMKSTNVHQIAGVIAHEIGHITGGHLNKRARAYEDSLFSTVLSSILAVGAIAAGQGQAGTAILLGGQHISRQQALSFSRNQESYADQAAIKLVKKTNYSLKGMYEMFEILERKERFSRINPYLQTHPLSSERKKILKYHIDDDIKPNFDRKLEKRLSLIRAKLIGYTAKKDKFNIFFPSNKNTLESWYARSIFLYLNGSIKESIMFIDKCIQSDKSNPYFYELKGQIYYENGNAQMAINNFEKALKIKKNEKHFFIALAKALYSSNDIKKFEKSIELLKKYIEKEEYPIEAWHYLGLCYGKMGDYFLSSLALTEKFLLLNDIKNAKLQLIKAKNNKAEIKKYDSRINDLTNIIKQRENK